jgi:protein-S-isoprenylcysteine O-methyltransferase Ste14
MATRTLTWTPKLVVQLLIVVVLIPLLPLLVSGQWGWGEAWVYAVVATGGFVVSRWLAARQHPDLLAERGQMLAHENIEPWDRWLAPIVGVGSGIIPLAAGVSARMAPEFEFGWPPKAAALAMILGGYALGTWALVENRYFSGVVRLQMERGHTVVSTGPYGWVRHPGYAGALLSFVATPVWLDAPWALLAAGVVTVALIVRTALEDRTLRERLPGYRAYAERVRYRLLPGVW